MARYHLGCQIEQASLGTIFTKWPLHITLVPWFIYDGAVDDLAERIVDKLKGLKAFEVQVLSLKMFGPNKDIPVRLVEKTKPMMSLHARLYHLLVSIGCQVEKEEYNTLDYMPHITVRGNRQIDSGVRLSIDSIDLIKNLQDGHKSREIVQRINFGTQKR